ncbi:amidohydrolase family protein [Marinobacterium aestuariivivens]|uniref:Amidohydrolase family protein n=1 Tax=Marinobacterium aestuariivivens TaxID=1698799 RepID=A0ABW2A733_9GAMM
MFQPRGRLLAPGFIDTQVNGGGGVLFNDRPEPEAIAIIGRAHRRYGTTGFLPTLISDRPQTMARAIDATREAIATVPGVLGIHLEGPYLNLERKGIHPAASLRVPEKDAFSLLTGLGQAGCTLVTLAPERVPPGFIRQLSEAGVLVAAGHTAARYEQVREALGQGLRALPICSTRCRR